jgi:myo-inositol-1(or 4)-monophosphatase
MENYYSFIKTVERAGTILIKYFGKNLEIIEKSTLADFRTKADLKVDAFLRKSIEKDYPNYNYFTEENGFTDKSSDYTFIIDPLDGTNNFMLGISQFSISVAILFKGKIIFGIIHNPVMKLSYYAHKGSGAYLNHSAIKVNSTNNLQNSTVSYTTGYLFPLETYTENFKKLVLSGIKRCTTLWSPALDYCLLASGKIEAILNQKNDKYDFLAGKLIAKEAGAKVTDLQGNEETNDENSEFLISNGMEIHNQLLFVLNSK